MKKKTAELVLLIFCITALLSGSGIAEGAGIITMQQEAEEQLQRELGAFEITANQREMAKANEAGYPVLDAGRGNPNWINTQARYAFTRFSDFDTQECERDMSVGAMAGHAQKEGIGDRFDAAMNPENSTAAFLIAAVDYCVAELGLDKDSLLKELADVTLYGEFRDENTAGGGEKIFCAYENYKKTDGVITSEGEHIMRNAKPLTYREEFLGSMETMTDYADDEADFRGIFINWGEDKDEVLNWRNTLLHSQKD